MRNDFPKGNRALALDALQRAFAASNSGLPYGGTVIVIANTGSDTRGNGSFQSPYATIAKANAVAATLIADLVVAVTICFLPGVWPENWQFLPGVSYMGFDPGNSPQLNGTVTFSPLWSEFIGSYSAFVNLDLNNGFDLDDSGVGGYDADIYMIDCQLIGAGTLTSIGTQVPSANWSLLHTEFCVMVSAVTITNAGIEAFANEYRSTLTVDATGGNSALASRMNQNSIAAVVLNETGGGNLPWTGEGTQISALTLNGTGVTFSGLIADIPGSVTLTGGAAAPVITGLVPYTAAVPGNWAGSPPTTLANAIDRIAANTTNTHPIP